MKAQMEAPVELFVAVIILALSMSLAFFVFQQTQTGQCISTLKTEVNKLQAAMQDVSLASPPTRKTVDFVMPSCPEARVEGIQFVRFNDPNLCRLCPSHYGGCWQIRPVTYVGEGTNKILVPITDAIACVELSGDVDIHQAPSSSCQGTPETPVVDFEVVPCPDGTDCNTDLSSSITSDAIWNTLGRGTGRVFEITLTKGISTGSGQTAKIELCAKQIN
ncbi:MAG: hypothetical protein V1834_00375 [Candidatus Micrarchaeota archaeon]